MLFIDRRQDPQPRRRLHPSLSLAPRDPLKGPPLRPRKGQRHEARQEVVWRVDAACPFYTYTFNDTPNPHIVRIILGSNATCARLNLSRHSIIHCSECPSFHEYMMQS